MKPDGGPAFPFEYDIRNEGNRVPHIGMSLRQWYAGMVASAFFANPRVRATTTDADIAAALFKFADAMIAEGNKE
jgi:hypothetical protein